MPVVTSEPIQVSYFVADIASALTTYNRLRWYRSRTGQDGTFEPASAPTVQPATLLARNLTPHQINGRTLSLRINGTTQVDVTFADPNPVTTAQAATAVDGASVLITASDEGGYLRVTTVATGTGASIEVLASDAAPHLGWDTGEASVGLGVDTTLAVGTHEYFYTDQNSDESFWYAVEFRHNTGPQTTGRGVPFPAESPARVPASQTIVCFIRLASLDGSPLVGRQITFFNAFKPNTVTFQDRMWGVFRHYAQMETDRNGYAEIRILRDIEVDFSVGGTGFVRRIRIPATGDLVNLLDPALVISDEFGIAEPNIDFAIRTT